MRRLLADFSLASVVAGFVAVLVGFTSSVAIVFAAAQALGATPADATSWILALGIGMAVTSIGLSLAYRQPVLTAWSTPGAALIAGTSGLTLAEATGAFLLVGVATVAAGATRAFERVMDRIPQSIAAALLAGVLLRFALDAAGAATAAPLLVLGMAAAYLVARRAAPRYAVPLVLAAGIAIAAAEGRIALGAVPWHWPLPRVTAPQFTLPAAVGLALPLFIVTMASQNLPGVAVQRACGYTTPVSPVITATGFTTLLLAPFGGFSFNLAAITAAICMGREAHEDPARRYTAAVAAGAFYAAAALAAGAVAGLLAAFPRELVVVVAGLALLATIGGGLAAALAEAHDRDAALITFVVSASGVTFGGIGAAFWGVLAGGVAWQVAAWRRRR